MRNCAVAFASLSGSDIGSHNAQYIGVVVICLLIDCPLPLLALKLTVDVCPCRVTAHTKAPAIEDIGG